MSKVRRACAVVLSNLGLVAVLAFLQTAGAAPEKGADAKEVKKAEKAKAPDKDKATADKQKAAAEDKASADKVAKEKEAAAKGKAAAKTEAAPAAKKKVGGAAKVAQVKAAAAAAAPPVGPPAPLDNELTDNISLPTDRKIKQRLEHAEDDYIRKQEWEQACRLLQSVLDGKEEGKEDVFVQVRRKGANNQEKVRWVSARAEANRLLGTMPSNGLEVYELLYSAEAKRLLTDAKAKGDPQLLAEVAQLFFHTKAGAEATDLLGTYHLDRGNAIVSALCYKRLLLREGADQLSPLTLFKAALALRRSGDSSTKDLAQQAWKRLNEKVGRDGFRLGEETVGLDQLQTELKNAPVLASASPYDWPLFRGSPSRSAQARGSAPFLKASWQRSSLLTENTESEHKLSGQTKQWIEQALQLQQSRKEVMIPAFFPVAASNKVIYRSYFGIHAVDIKTGTLCWDSRALVSLEQLVSDANNKQQVGEWFNLYMQGSAQNILFENSTIGSLSTDNTRVYAVDDLALPPHPNSQAMQALMWGNGGLQLQVPLRDYADGSRLVAIDVETGKIAWERPVKDSIDPERKDSLQKSHFLGPPLPLAGRLYVLVESNSELKLICLDAAKGETVWTQTLATARDRMLMDPSRRVQAVHLAYGEGILVCPTNAGAILGVDLLSRSLVWAFPYREKTKNPNDQDQMMGGMGGRVWRGMAVGQDWNTNLQKLSADWKMSAPIIYEGKVVFTAHDGKSIHCLNLQDGDSLWQADRRDDIYLAGVFQGRVVVVGKDHCRALSLNDGKQLWQVETGTPSGQGVASGPFYYLPLKNGKVCKINLEKGIVEAASPALDNEVPGNLVFYEGNVVSQTESAVTCYPQAEFIEAQITAQLQMNPNDPVALINRGELRLFNGKLEDAASDLDAALKNHPPKDMLPQTREKLYTTLTELMRLNFGKAKQYLGTYKELCKIDIPADATPEQRKKLEAEQQRRHAGFLCLYAKGCEDEGQLLQAFQAYLDFGALPQSEQQISIINEKAVQARPEIWAQGRIADLVAKATPEQRKSLEEEIGKRFKAAQASKDPEALRHFVNAFGSLFAIGGEARLQLAERCLEENKFLEAELQLRQLRREQEYPQIGARAVEALARLMSRKGLLDDAAYYYQILARDFAHVVVRDGKTGADFLQDLASDKRFVPYLDDPGSPWADSKLGATTIPDRAFPQEQIWYFEPKGDVLPSFQRQRLGWVMTNANGAYSFQLRVIDRDSNEEIWRLAAQARAMFNPSGSPNSLRFPYYGEGHLAVLYLGHMVYGVDLVERKVLWKKDLLGSRLAYEQPGQPQHMLSLDQDGGLQLQSPQGTIEKIGQIAAVTSSYVCLRTANGLVALDPVYGDANGEPKELWSKTDISSSTQLFGDDEYVYLVDVREDHGNSIGSTRALRGRDGASVNVPDFAKEFKRHKRILGGRLLVSENDPTGGLVVRLYDVRSGENLWKKTLAPNTVILRGDNPELAGMVEPNGKLTIVDLRARPKPKEVFHAQVSPAHMEKVNDGVLLQDSRQYYVALNRPPEQNLNQQGFMPGMGMPGGFMAPGIVPNQSALRGENVNGMVYAFERATGEFKWLIHAPNQMILLQDFQELPMVVFTAQYHQMVNARGGGFNQVTVTFTVHKITGKLIFDERLTSGFPPGQPAQFYALRIDRRSGTIDLISPKMRPADPAEKNVLRHYIVDNGTNQNGQSGVRYDGPEGEYRQPLGEVSGPVRVRVPKPPPPERN